MKRPFILLLALQFFCSAELIAQLNISTDLRKDGVWNNEEEEWTIVSTDEEQLTFFEFSKEFTMFKHTTPTITSAYLIKSQQEDVEREQYEFSIVSDVGNKYHMVVDFRNKNLRFIYERDGQLIMVWHRIKRMWFDEEED